MLNHNEIRARMLKIIATESDDTAWTISNKHLMSLVTMYVEEERESCANVCDKASAVSLPAFLAMQIRARGIE